MQLGVGEPGVELGVEHCHFALDRRRIEAGPGQQLAEPGEAIPGRRWGQLQVNVSGGVAGIGVVAPALFADPAAQGIGLGPALAAEEQGVFEQVGETRARGGFVEVAEIDGAGQPGQVGAGHLGSDQPQTAGAAPRRAAARCGQAPAQVAVVQRHAGASSPRRDRRPATRGRCAASAPAPSGCRRRLRGAPLRSGGGPATGRRPGR